MLPISRDISSITGGTPQSSFVQHPITLPAEDGHEFPLRANHMAQATL